MADDGVAVPLVSMSTVLRSVEGRRVDMLKVDPEVADPVPIAHAIRAQGFTFYPAGTLRARSAEIFVRET